MNDRSRLRASTLAFATAGLAAGLCGGTFTVTNTNDSGVGSLRQAILDANALPGADFIDFALPGDGVHTIGVLSPMVISDPVYIDGYTQPGASPNSNPPGQGFNNVIQIEVRGPATPDSPCFQVAAGNVDEVAMVIQGLAIRLCSDAILVMAGGDSAFIRQNFIGTEASGSFGVTGLNGGIRVENASGVRIASNLVSGVSSDGISLSNAPASLVLGNMVGPNAAGDAVVPAQGGGIYVASGSGGTVIGGTTPDARNVVSGLGTAIFAGGGTEQIVGNFVGTDVTGTRPLGNGIGIFLTDDAIVTGNVIGANAFGVEINSPTAFPTIQGNFIGTDSTGTIVLGNRIMGIYAAGHATIGGTGAGEGNVIVNNGDADPSKGAGIYVLSGQVNIRGNRIFDNQLLGIDLGDVPPGVTPNDPGDTDIQNDMTLQNFPVITGVTPGASTTHIEGSLNSLPAQTFDIDLFAAPACPRRPKAHLQGETYLGSLQVSTDGLGNATFARDVPFVLAAGQLATATATDPFGNTSEFSQRIVFSVDPPSGPGAGASATVHGMLFEPGATVTVGGIPATNVVSVDPETITATMPALAPGTLHGVTVSVPGGLVSTLPNGWLTDFLDVPVSNLFHDYVTRLVINGVAGGVGAGNYGVAQSTLRQQMAVFLLKGKHGVCYTPPQCTGTFGDVQCPSPFADWIEALSTEGITSGCGGGNYCPQNPVRRDQMAAFLLKAEHGADYVPPPCAATFDDVACPSLFADWIQQLAAEGITGGCGGGNYCPGANAIRGQMAAFVSKTFSLP